MLFLTLVVLVLAVLGLCLVHAQRKAENESSRALRSLKRNSKAFGSLTVARGVRRAAGC